MPEISENEMIRLILRYYAGQNMSDGRTFKATITAFGWDQYFNHDQEIELLKQKMMEVKLLRSKNGRLMVTNHGRDIVMKHGGWDNYIKNLDKLEQRKTLVEQTLRWLPLAVSIVAIIVPWYQNLDLKSDIKELQRLQKTQTLQIDSLKSAVRTQDSRIKRLDSLSKLHKKSTK